MPSVLIIGAGGIAGRHLKGISQIEGLRVAGVCDLSAERAAALAARAGPGTATFTDPGRAAEATRPDYAAILTPRGVREPLVNLCIARRLPFLVEKPPCDRLSVGRRIAEKLRAAGLLHSVGFMHRWHESLNAVLAELRGERLSLVAIRFTAPFATAPAMDQYPDPYLVERSGGLVGDQGIHYVDLARYVAGSEVAAMAASGTNQLLPRSERVTTCDAASWTLRMAGGALVSHAHTWCAAGWDCRVELVTDRSDVVVNMFGNRAEGTLRGAPYRFEGSADEFELEHRGFLKALAAGDQSLVRSSYADALESFCVAGEINRLLYGESRELDS